VSELGTVLVVDDEVGSRESRRAILKPDYQVLIATEGEHALHLGSRGARCSPLQSSATQSLSPGLDRPWGRGLKFYLSDFVVSWLSRPGLAEEP
jgi:hypothetical protein